MSDRLRCPLCSCAIFFLPLCTRDRGCSAHPAFPAPSCLRDNEIQASGASRRENADVYLKSETELPAAWAALAALKPGSGAAVQSLGKSLRIAISAASPGDSTVWSKDG